MNKLFDIKINQIKLARDRGYKLSGTDDEKILQWSEDDEEYEKSLSLFKDYVEEVAKSYNEETGGGMVAYRKALCSYYEHETLLDPNTGKPRTMLAYFGGRRESTKKQVPLTEIHDFRDACKRVIDGKKHRVYEAILIVDAPLSPEASKSLKNLLSVKWQLFNESELMFNVVEHVMVPRHELVPSTEVPDLLTRMRVRQNQLPIILSKDPVIKYYGWHPGDIIKIFRDDSAMGLMAPLSITYRYVIHSE